MKCCVNCFSSRYLQSIIHSFSPTKGDCDFCLSKNVDWCEPRELQNYFINILELYTTLSNIIGLGIDVGAKDLFLGPIAERICIDFPGLVFKPEFQSSSDALLRNIFIGMDDYQVLFDDRVGFEHLFNDNSYDGSNQLIASWNNFVDEIKKKNRFHLSARIDLPSLERVLSNYVRNYPAGKIFYRGRISEKNGFDKNNMGHPPASKAKAGRANPVGISYLYVAESVDTTLYETRAGLYDYVCIGEFTVREELAVISLRETHLYDPIELADNDKLRDFVLNLPFLSTLENELSKPLRRSDNELDYLPTQYLSEFIKSLGYDGIAYRSSLNPSGYNIAIFHPEKLTCTKAYVHEIQGVAFTHTSSV